MTMRRLRSGRSLLLLLACLLAGRASAWSLVDRFTFGGSMFPENDRGGSNALRTMRRRTRRRRRFLAAPDDDEYGNSSPNRRSNQQTQQDLLRFMDRPMASTVGDVHMNADGSGANMVLDDGLLDLVHCVVRAADGRKAENIVALQVHHVSTLASVLVILSGNSRPQNQAIAAAVADAVAEQFGGRRPGGSGVPEGSAESGWMLLDYGSVMVHIMTPKSRLFYNVEGQWKEKGGIYLDLSDILVPNTAVLSEQQQQQAAGAEQQPLGSGFVAEEDDPFWS